MKKWESCLLLNYIETVSFFFSSFAAVCASNTNFVTGYILHCSFPNALYVTHKHASVWNYNKPYTQFFCDQIFIVLFEPAQSEMMKNRQKMFQKIYLWQINDCPTDAITSRKLIYIFPPNTNEMISLTE